METCLIILCIYIVIVLGATEGSAKGYGYGWRLLIFVITFVALPTLILLTIGEKLIKWIDKEDRL